MGAGWFFGGVLFGMGFGLGLFVCDWLRWASARVNRWLARRYDVDF